MHFNPISNEKFKGNIRETTACLIIEAITFVEFKNYILETFVTGSIIFRENNRNLDNFRR